MKPTPSAKVVLRRRMIDPNGSPDIEIEGMLPKHRNNSSITIHDDVGAFCSSEQFEEMQITVEGLQAALGKMLDRLETTETQLEQMKKLVSGGTTKAAERAITLNEVVRDKGFIKKAEARKLLKCHHTEAKRAMEEAADMFDDLHVVKNTSNHWVLAVIQ